MLSIAAAACGSSTATRSPGTPQGSTGASATPTSVANVVATGALPQTSAPSSPPPQNDASTTAASSSGPQTAPDHRLEDAFTAVAAGAPADASQYTAYTAKDAIDGMVRNYTSKTNTRIFKTADGNIGCVMSATTGFYLQESGIVVNTSYVTCSPTTFTYDPTPSETCVESASLVAQAVKMYTAKEIATQTGACANTTGSTYLPLEAAVLVPGSTLTVDGISCLAGAGSVTCINPGPIRRAFVLSSSERTLLG
jgi:hypothetical protein